MQLWVKEDRQDDDIQNYTRSDVAFSSQLLYFLLCLRLPFLDTQDLMHQHATTVPVTEMFWEQYAAHYSTYITLFYKS